MKNNIDLISGRKRMLILSALTVMLLSVTVLMFVNTGDEVSGADQVTEKVDGINYRVIMIGGQETDAVEVIALPSGEKYHGKINIPAKVTFSNGVTYNVVEIGEETFQNCYALTSVVIPKDVVTIGTSAFSSCTALTTVIMPKNVVTIGSSAFQNCSALTSVVIPDCVENVGVGAFLHCPALKTVTISGDGVNSTTAVLELFEKDGWTIYTDTTVDVLVIDTSAELNLEDIKIPEGKMLEFTSKAMYTKGGTFYDTSGNELTGIERSSKTFIKNDDGVSWKVGEIVFKPAFIFENAGDGVLVSMDANSIGYKGPVIIPSTDGEGNIVVGIQNKGFMNCKGITSIDMPSSVKTIGYGAFYRCYALTSVDIPGSVETIDKNTFQQCYALTSVDIPGSVETIDESAFQNCYALSSVNIPDGVVTIAGHAFYSCYALTSVVIPDSVVTIGSWAFAGNSPLTSVVIPDGVAIGNSAFAGCYALTSVTISALGDGNGSVLSKYFKEGSWKLEGSSEIKTLTIDTSDKIDIEIIGTPENKTLILSKKATNTTGQESKMFCNGIEVTGKERAGKTYTAIEGNWISYAEYDVKLTTNSDEYGSVRGSGTYAYGSNVTIKAIPKDGYQFISWSDGNTSATRNLTVTSDVSLKATFADTSAVVYVVNITIEGKGQVYVTGTFKEGSVVTLYAVAENGHSFQKWSHTSSTSTLVSFQLFADTNITATFSSDSAFGGNGNGMTIDNTTAMMIIIIVVAALALLIVVVVIRGRAR